MLIKKHQPRPQGFTLIELLIVIAIIGILTTLATVALNGARGRARDARRISDIKQLQTALELYFSDENSYPATLVANAALIGSDSLKTYMAKVPSNPSPRLEGACSVDTDYVYTQKDSGASYEISYCLARAVSELPAGQALATPKGIHVSMTSCSPSCNGKCSGDDNCGGLCPNNCAINTYCSAGSNTCVAIGSVTYSTECNTNTSLGTACGGGWLVCKPGDGNCTDSPLDYVVVAPVNSGSGVNWSTAVSNCVAYSNSGFSGWSLPRMANGSIALVQLDNLGSHNELCQLVKRSSACKLSSNNSTACDMECYGVKPIVGITSSLYWSVNEVTLSDDPDNSDVWFQVNTSAGSQGTTEKLASVQFGA